MPTLFQKEAEELRLAYQAFVRAASCDRRSERLVCPSDGEYKKHLTQARNAPSHDSAQEMYQEAVYSLRNYIASLQGYQQILKSDISTYQRALAICDQAVLRAARGMKRNKAAVTQEMDRIRDNELGNRKHKWDKEIRDLQKRANDISSVVKNLENELKHIETERKQRPKVKK
jgi:uncharacterized protein YlxW (UPF0749 family)